MGIFTKKNKDSKNDKDIKDIKKTEKTEKTEKVDKIEKKQSMKDLYGNGDSQKKQDNKDSQDNKDKDSDNKDDKKITKNKFSNAYKVLVKPLVTEKATNLGSESKYVFVVQNSANKIEISKAVNSIYGINPISVNIIKTKGKKKRHGKTTGKRKDWKKAIVTLPKGKSINVYEGV